MKKILLSSLLFTVLLSCEKSKPTREPDPYIDSIQARMKANERIQFEEIDRKLEAHAKAQKQYIFVRLLVEEDYGMDTRRANFVSGIQDITHDLSEDEKAQMEDLIISNYLSSPDAQIRNGRVKKKEMFVFGSYAEASEKRNTFLITE
ncbi:hypothetical protein SAMN05421841_1087 [Chryseobacterium wanjuense]|uniref:Uncharacterized protein n=1 Tax=Chryseobacterium wanjuense TaxID=356305 RepID=A0A1I0PA28_9FLAO|nr:hypothetical protein [Chryseobacterium wanjuense]SEW11121.1 hypothetical protein SAMN05421841_1087 [Chryseobacterium wanjuense]